MNFFPVLSRAGVIPRASGLGLEGSFVIPLPENLYVRGELTYPEYSTIEAHCRIDNGPPTVVPLTLLPPVE